VANVTLVQCDVEDAASLLAAMSGAQMVVSAIGAPESQPLDSSLPKRIDGQGGKNLVDAAKACGVEHFVMVSSLGTGAFGWPASVLNLFWYAPGWGRPGNG
jgi:nucleoside-diphosphate-sugar epimerase